MSEFAGKVVVVTGGASGIGRALCERFSRDGARGVVVADLDDTLARQVGEAHRGPPPDDAAQERLAQTLSATLQRYLTDLHQGRLDPRHIDHHFKSSVRAVFDSVARLREGLQAGRLAELVRLAGFQKVAQRIDDFGIFTVSLARRIA